MAGNIPDFIAFILPVVLVLASVATLVWRVVQIIGARHRPPAREKRFLAWGSFTYYSEIENVEALPVEKREEHKGFVITWHEPPLTSDKWTVNVGSDDPRLHHAIGGLNVIGGRTREDALRQARKLIEGVIGAKGASPG